MGKIVTKEQFLNLREGLKQDHKKIILCHGVFDLIHPGHIIHFEEAKSLGDVLVVSVTAAAYVRKGPGRPYFSDELRLKFLSAIECIDYVMLSEEYTVDDIICTVEPDLYVKGAEYSNEKDDITGKITEETELVRKHGGEVYFTSGQVFSSTKLINVALPAMSEELKEFVARFKEGCDFRAIQQKAERLKSLKVLVVGDVIIDEYVFCTIQGLMTKDMGYSARYINSEQYLGGSLAVARHISSFCDNVTIMSVVGKENEIHSRLLNELGNKMRVDLVYSDEFNTIIKKRYIMENEKREEFHKVFSINNLSEIMEIDTKAMAAFKKKLSDVIGQYDVVITSDFGHGLIDREVIQILEDKARFLSVNCQTNSSNYGMNLITKYNRADAFALDQKELRLAFSDYNLKEEDALKKLSHKLNCFGWLTRGSKGAMAVNAKGEILNCPAFTLKVKDTIGAGDAFFAVASLFAALDGEKKPEETGVFMGNVAGALASNIVGNKDAIDKINVMKYVNTLLNL